MYLPVLTVHWPVPCVRPPGGVGLSHPAPRHSGLDREPLLPSLGRPPSHRQLVQGHLGQGAPGDPGPAIREGDNWGKSLLAKRIVLKTSQICIIMSYFGVQGSEGAGVFRLSLLPGSREEITNYSCQARNRRGQTRATILLSGRPATPTISSGELSDSRTRQLVLVLLLSCHWNYIIFILPFSSCCNPTDCSYKIQNLIWINKKQDISSQNTHVHSYYYHY